MFMCEGGIVLLRIEPLNAVQGDCGQLHSPSNLPIWRNIGDDVMGVFVLLLESHSNMT